MKKKLAIILTLVGVLGVVLLRGPEPDTVNRRIYAATVQERSGTYLIDFGEAWFGNVIVKPNSDNIGRTVVLTLGEKLDAEGRVDTSPYGSVRSFRTRLELGRSPVSPGLETRDSRGIESGGVLPFRYAEIEGWVGDLPNDALTLKARVSRQFSRRGSIRFSDEPIGRDLNRLIELGTHTLEATSFMGVFVDGDRERIPYEADAYINQLGWYAVTGDWTVPRKTFEALIEKPTWPTEWQTHMILMAWADYAFTGDPTLIQRHYERLKLLSLIDLIDETGLVTTANDQRVKKIVARTGGRPLSDIVDWPPEERDDYDMRPYNTVVNAFVYVGLKRMAEIAGVLGRSEDRQRFEGASIKLKEAMEAKLVDSEKGLFLDGLGSSHISAHALFFPLAFGLVPEQRKQATIDALKQRIKEYGGGFPCSVYGAQYLLEALFLNGEGALAIRLILNRTDRGWLHMLDAHSATITHEAWDLRYKDNLDWTHPWGTAFLNVLYRFVLGAEPVAGRSTWSIRPAFALGLDVQGVVPTPIGTLEIAVDSAGSAAAVRDGGLSSKASPPR